MSDPVTLTTRGPSGMITLRGDLATGGLADALRAATGCDVPGRRRIVRAGDCSAAWMSPDELLLFVPHADAPALTADLARALDGTHHLAVDVSDARAHFALTGAGAREVLAKGAPVDLAPAAFGAGDLRRTRLGQVAVAIFTHDAATFELVCFRSVAGFVETWLTLAATPGTLPGFLPAEAP